MKRPKFKDEDLIYLFPEEHNYLANLNKYIDYLEKLVEEQRQHLDNAFDASLKKNIQLLVDDLKK